MKLRHLLLIVLLLPLALAISCNRPCPPAAETPITLNLPSYQEYPRTATVESKSFKDPDFDLSSVIALQPHNPGDSNAFNYLMDSSIRFWQDTFRNTASFSNINFRQWADFSHDRFDSDLLFMGDTIGRFSLYGSSIARGLSFFGTQFRQTAWFSNMQMGDTAMLDFTDATLPDTLFFTGITQIPAEIDLTVANYKDSSRLDCQGNYRRHNILLYRTDFSKFHFDYKFFRLIFEDTMHNIRISSDEKISVYESALKNFNDRGQLESYRLLDLEYQQYKWGRPWFHGFWWLPKIWWNYGYTKELIFAWTIGLALLFTLINYKLMERLNEKAYEIPLMKTLGPNPSFFRKLWYSLLYTSYIFFRLTLDFDRMKYNNIAYTAYILVIYTSGIVCLAYLANYVIQR